MAGRNGSPARLERGVAALGTLGIAVGTAHLATRLRSFFHVNGELTSGTARRRYLLHVPAGHDPHRPAPLVVVIHGFMQSPAHQRQMSRWDDFADAEGFLTVYPMGTGFPLRWASHEPAAESAQTRDQVRFVSELVQDLSARYTIDSDRVFASGMSNGGGLACVLARELPEVFAAVGSVAGLYTYPPVGPPTDRPVPLIAFHGALDRIVPIGGGVKRLGRPVPPVAEWIASYAGDAGCTIREDAEVAENVRCTRYSGGPQDAEVVLYRVADGGHSWPGGVPLPEFITGPTSPSIDATAVTWEFFRNHPRTVGAPQQSADGAIAG